MYVCMYLCTYIYMLAYACARIYMYMYTFVQGRTYTLQFGDNALAAKELPDSKPAPPVHTNR